MKSPAPAPYAAKPPAPNPVAVITEVASKEAMFKAATLQCATKPIKVKEFMDPLDVALVYAEKTVSPDIRGGKIP